MNYLTQLLQYVIIYDIISVVDFINERYRRY